MARVQTWHKQNRARINETRRALYVPTPQGTCAASDCETGLRQDNKTGYCTKHFELSRRAKHDKTCASEGCGKVLWNGNRNGFCLEHRTQSAAYKRQSIAGVHARRARKLKQFVEYVDPEVVWQRDEGVCHICDLPADPEDWHLEHVIALANGGEHSYANTAVSHPICNLKKGAK